MKISIIFDNLAKEGFKPAWGFSALIETSKGEKVLFDTGSSYEVWKYNAHRLGIGLEDFEHVFLSHFHWDHIGSALDIAHASKRKKHFLITEGFSKVFVKEIAALGHQVSLVREPYRFSRSFISTGALKSEDYNLYEHSLIAFDGEDYTLVVGCSHPGIVEITRRAIDLTKKEPKLVVGGFHLFNEDEITIIAIAEELLHLGVKYVAPCHCTGERGREIFKDVFGKHYLNAVAGEVIKI